MAAGRAGGRLALASVLMLLGAGCGNEKTPPTAQKTRPDPFESIRARSESPRPKQAGPRWETVMSKSGNGDSAIGFEVSQESIQSRVQYGCETGAIKITTEPAPTNKKPLAEEQCPKQGESFFTRKGKMKLIVTAGGPWQVTVQHQVTTPLVEAPPPELTAPGARLAARGDFYSLERKSSGKALLYRLADGRLALRLEDFDTSANTDLFVWFSDVVKPENSKQAAESRYDEFAELKSTLGDQNYLVDPGTLKNLKPDEIKSVVIWCQPVRIAYAAATLMPL
ncbi:MAG: DM13 domain-containing protein [Actinomycetota bacterium]